MLAPALCSPPGQQKGAQAQQTASAGAAVTGGFAPTVARCGYAGSCRWSNILYHLSVPITASLTS